MKVEKEIKNDLLERKEIVVSLESESNPGFEKVKKMVAEKFKAPEENIVIRGVHGNFGRSHFSSEVFVYDSKEALDKIERKPRVKTGGAK